MNDSAKSIGVLGTGRMGTRLARMFARAGRRVVLGSRNVGRAKAVAAELREPALTGGTYDDALRADVLLPAIFVRDGLLDVLEANRHRLGGKLLIDISNPFNDDYSDFLTPWDSSGAELIRDAVPEARIVGAFKNTFWAVFDAPQFDEGTSDVLVVGDDDAAKADFIAMAEGTPFRYLDAGPLINARAIERLTMITGRLGRQLGIYPGMNWRLLGKAA